MAGILDSLSSVVTPELIGKVGKSIGVEPALVSKGFATIGPVLLGSLARTASSPQGSASLLKLLPQPDESLIGRLGGMLSGGLGGGQTGIAQSLLGSSSTAITSTVSQRLGFDVRPLMGMALPLVTGLLAKKVRTEGVDAPGLSRLLLSENDAFMKNPANKEAAGVVFSALAAGDKAKALRESFDEAEWLKVRMGPATALYHVVAASVSGPAGLAKEFTAAAGAVSAATQSVPAISLIGAAFGDGLKQEDLERLGKDHPSSDELLDGLRRGYAAVSRKSPADARAYREMVISVAEHAAAASKEGGFLGIGGTAVNDSERRALDDIRSALS